MIKKLIPFDTTPLPLIDLYFPGLLEYAIYWVAQISGGMSTTDLGNNALLV